MDEHRSAQLVLQRTVAGGVSDAAGATAAELERALAHVALCEDCSRRFDVAETAAWLESREDTQAMAHVPVDPSELFERALTAAFSDPDDVVRRRAAVSARSKSSEGSTGTCAIA